MDMGQSWFPPKKWPAYDRLVLWFVSPNMTSAELMFLFPAFSTESLKLSPITILHLLKCVAYHFNVQLVSGE